jgi:hypothetical protein
MSNPDRSTHASETCWVVLTALVILALVAATIWSVVGAY